MKREANGKTTVPPLGPSSRKGREGQAENSVQGGKQVCVGGRGGVHPFVMGIGTKHQRFRGRASMGSGVRSQRGFQQFAKVRRFGRERDSGPSNITAP